MRLHNGELLNDGDEAKMSRLNLSPGEYLRRRRNGRLLVAGYVAGVAATALFFYVRDWFEDESHQPVCELPIEAGDTINELQQKLKDNGDDVESESWAVRAGDDGHVRNPKDDPRMFADGNIALEQGDSLLIDNTDADVCAEAEGRPVLHDDKGDRREQPDFLKESLERTAEE